MVGKKSSVEIISTTIIKPSSPTPNHKKYLKLSLLDQTFSRSNGSMLYCYNPPADKSLTTLPLQKALSKTLELFYPFAGRFNDDLTSIECNDCGAIFLEARTSSNLSDFLKNPDPKTTSKLLASSDPKTLCEATRDNVVTLVQLTVFSCGGIAIGIDVSHKIADGFSVSHFAKTWAAISAGKNDVPPPVFPGSSIHPPPVSPIRRISLTPPKATLRSRRFVFTAAKLADLKKRIQQNGGVDFSPSTLEGVSSLLLRSIVGASGASALLQMVNLRTRLTPSLPENCIGNFAWPLMVSSEQNICVTEIHEITAIIRKELSEFFKDCEGGKLKGEALVPMVSRFATEEAELAKAGIGLNWVSFVSSLRLYNTDFGWGEPAWATSPLFFDKHITMAHSKSGQDIEVWATFEENIMGKLERNQELLAFASVDVPEHMN